MNQSRDLTRGCDICIATPGRLNDLCKRGVISWSKLKMLVFGTVLLFIRVLFYLFVIDEADRMLDSGFEPQIRETLEDYDMPSERQTMMFSATFPTEVRELARDFLGKYCFLTIGRVGSTMDSITQKLEWVSNPHQKLDLLQKYIQAASGGLTLVFVQTKRMCDRLEDDLPEVGINAIAIHGDRTQSDREFAMRQFKSGRAPVLLATDVASRGWFVFFLLNI